VAFVTEAGPERAVPATKTFTTQLAALAVLAIGLGADLDAGELRGVPDEIDRMLAEDGDLDPIVAELADVAGVVVSGRGLAYSAALELALKLKEACYLHAMGLSYADLLHGPMAVVDAQTPAIIVAADSGPVLAGTIDLARRVTTAGARAYAIGGGPGLAAVSSRVLAGPRLPEWLAPLGLIVPGQLLTEALARRRGIDPDNPRGLSKGDADRLRPPESWQQRPFARSCSTSTARWWTASRATMRPGVVCSRRMGRRLMRR